MSRNVLVLMAVLLMSANTYGQLTNVQSSLQFRVWYKNTVDGIVETEEFKEPAHGGWYVNPVFDLIEELKTEQQYTANLNSTAFAISSATGKGKLPVSVAPGFEIYSELVYFGYSVTTNAGESAKAEMSGRVFSRRHLRHNGVQNRIYHFDGGFELHPPPHNVPTKSYFKCSAQDNWVKADWDAANKSWVFTGYLWNAAHTLRSPVNEIRPVTENQILIINFDLYPELTPQATMDIFTSANWYNRTHYQPKGQTCEASGANDAEGGFNQGKVKLIYVQ